MKNYLQPKVSILAKRSKCWNWLQENNEPVTAYVTKLQNLSITCNFGNNLEEALRDQLVHGLNDLTLKKKLCEEKDLKFEKSKKILQAHDGLPFKLAYRSIGKRIKSYA